MPAKPFFFAASAVYRELYIGRGGSGARALIKPPALSHWSDEDWKAAQELGPVPRPYENAFLASFARTYTRLGYRMILARELAPLAGRRAS